MNIIRLKKNKDFQKIYQKGRFFAHPLIVLYVLKRPSTDQVRVGFAVGRKTGNAVKRNRVRRQLKEIFRLSSTSQLFNNCDLVIMARKKALETDYDSLKEAYDYVQNRALTFLNKEKSTKDEKK